MKRRRVSTEPYPHEGKTFRVKCGWCITDDHAHCYRERVDGSIRATVVCSCDCNGGGGDGSA